MSQALEHPLAQAPGQIPQGNSKSHQSYAVLQALLVHPAPPTALMIKYRSVNREYRQSPGAREGALPKDGKTNWSKKHFTCQWCDPGLEEMPHQPSLLDPSP